MIVDGYVRVSQVAGRSGETFISPRVQREQIEGWARLHGATVARVFEELDESGGRADRPLLLEAIERIEHGDSDGLVVAYMSRFGRSLTDGLGAIKRITDAGGSFVSVQESLDFSTDTGRLILRVLLSIAEWELDRYRANIRIATERAVERGVFPRRAPFGYVRSRKDGRLRVDKRTGHVVRELFRLRAAGASYAELHRWLTRRRIPTVTGQPWWGPCKVRTMLRQRVYLGESSYMTTVNPAAHPPLVDPDTWQRAQFGGLRTPRRKSRPPLLWGVVRCAYCRRPMSGQARWDGACAGEGTYRCHFHDARASCPSPVRIRQSALDPYIEQLFWQEVDKLRRPARSRRITRLEQALAHREQELASYRDNPHLPRRLDPERFADGLAVRQRRADLARAELSRAKDAAQPAALPPTAELQARWQYMTTEERRDAISRVIDCVFVWHGRGEPANRICVLRRGDAPPGLPNVGEWKLETPPPFERSTAPAGIRLRATDDWSEEQIRDALENFVHDRAAWPTYEEFQAAGRGLLYEQADRHGGHRSWATTFRLPLTMVSTDGKKWTHERIRSGLAKVIRGRQQWPTWQEFQAADAQPLRFAVNATGGPAFWAREMDVELPAIQQPNCRPWTYMRMKAEAARFIGQRGEWPRAREFEAAGLDGLHQAICKRGLQARIAADLGIPAPPTRKLRVRRWTPEEIRAALDEFLRGRDTWPTPREFSAAGLAGLRTVLYRNDIAEHWAAQYGLTIRRYQPGAGL